MMGILQDILGFVIAIGVLVAFHEFGHYWVARRLGVKVLRYSIGFGKPLLSWRGGRDQTEYVVAAIPLGGYVKMLDEREGEVAPEELHRAFNRKPVGVRAAIVAAGPIFNFLFAIVAYWLIFVGGSQEMRPVVGEVLPATPAAAAGLQRGDELVAVAGTEVRGWDQALLTLLDQGVSRSSIDVTVQTAGGQTLRRTLDLSGVQMLGDEQDFLKVLGVRPWMPHLPAVVGSVMQESPAAAAGLEPGDRVVAVDGKRVDDWRSLVEYVAARPGEDVRLSVDGVNPREVSVTLASRQNGEQSVGMLGVTPQVPEDAAALYQDMLREVQYGPWQALERAAVSTWTASSLTLKVMWRMIVGEASIKNLSGPLHIAQFAGDSVEMGLTAFLKFLAIVSVSLAVLNLLPVPVLDGGHLLYYAVEVVRGRPLSERAQGVGQQIGIALLFMLMAVAFYNDIARLMAN
jgi:regulator of sigma E protease